MSEELDAALRLLLTPKLGAATAAALRSAFGSYSAALSAPGHQWPERAGVPESLAAVAAGGRVSRQADSVRRECRRLGIVPLPLGAREYPEILAHIYDPPPVLFTKGDGDLAAACRRAVALVGTRRASERGRAFARRLASELTHAGVPIVSGLAFGIDITAHLAVLDDGGTAIAVLPGPLDRIHPLAHTTHARRITRRGCLVSEHPPGARVSKGMFVGRNRIISGLSRAVAIVEAGIDSGALRTAEFAIGQERDVLVMPGRPDDPLLAGALRLLRDGAHLLLGAQDILDLLGLEYRPPVPARLPPELEPIRESLRAGVTLDALVAASRLEPGPLLVMLGQLEVRGTIVRDGEGRYRLDG